MENRRNVLAASFIDLESQNKMAFIKELLQLEEFARLKILTMQYGVNGENITSIKQFLLQKKETYQSHTRYSTLLENINQISKIENLLQKSYKALPTKHRSQVILYLSYLEENEIQSLLTKQANLDINNLAILLIDLTQNTQYQSDEYIKIIHSILFIQESIQQSNAQNKLNTFKKDNKEINHSKTELLLEEEEASKEIQDFIKLFEDTIDLEIIEDKSVVTPQGTTYSLSNITQWIKIKNNDPLDRTTLTDNQLIPNHLFARIREIVDPAKLISKNITFNTIDKNKLRKVLTCLLSDELFDDPVLTQSGHTFERAYIEAYISKHGKTPLGERQTIPLYPNRFIKKLLELPVIQKLLQDDLLLGSSQNNYVNRLLEYKKTRIKEEESGILKYKKWDKLNAATNLIRVFRGNLSSQTFFSPHNLDLKILDQGRAKEIAEPAIKYLKTSNSLNS